jgi:hypothetical protein
MSYAGEVKAGMDRQTNPSRTQELAGRTGTAQKIRIEQWQSKPGGCIVSPHGHSLPLRLLGAAIRHGRWARDCDLGVVTWSAPERQSLARPRTMTVIEYKGYRIEVCPVGKGWRASIYSAGSTSPLPNSPTNLEKSGTEEIVVEAKRIIDARLGPRLV